jgi:hypothetical protein
MAISDYKMSRRTVHRKNNKQNKRDALDGHARYYKLIRMSKIQALTVLSIEDILGSYQKTH